MCTVTYIPTGDGFYLTSNRDEKASRATLPPTLYNINGIDIVYPRDEFAGGTWIASNYSGRIVCLLNGAFNLHVKESNYVRSRGLILLDSFKFENFVEFANCTELDNIEPFTMISVDCLLTDIIKFTEFRWDGTNKYLRHLDKSKCQIWSSATLYSPKIQLKREALFTDWIRKFEQSEGRNMLTFHSNKHGLNPSHEILMKSKTDLMTLSISQLHFRNGKLLFTYKDLLNNTIHSTEVLNPNKES